jgi:phosphoglucomutase
MRVADSQVELADDFSYADPVDGTLTAKQGVRIVTDNGARIIFRLSGTGTAGATLRIYLERYEPPAGALSLEPHSAVAPLALAATSIGEIARHTGLTRPTAQV